ncbi:hypothetical protein ANCCEY_07760 [Ancylostoma ceylanicum]|uniref:Uncharacterized protein n=1 Tax=Ancylostoma ceylanicum TaxID=53326 RepID=A0A0D6LMN9_9BILA|nr:hypothetical protein ANCCEY_07760 [Ancylostoma ceylanicum]
MGYDPAHPPIMSRFLFIEHIDGIIGWHMDEHIDIGGINDGPIDGQHIGGIIGGIIGGQTGGGGGGIGGGTIG